MPRTRAPAGNLVDMIRSDHANVVSLFREFENTRDELTKKEIAGQAIKELQIHTLLEEEYLYPLLEQTSRAELVATAREEHHVAKMLIGELEAMDAGERGFDAKFRVLAASVRLHIQEEERDLLPAIQSGDVDEVALAEMIQLKQELEDHPDKLADLFRDSIQIPSPG